MLTYKIALPERAITPFSWQLISPISQCFDCLQRLGPAASCDQRRPEYARSLILEITIKAPRLRHDAPRNLDRNQAFSQLFLGLVRIRFCRSPAIAVTRKRLGKALPLARSAASFSLRREIQAFSSSGRACGSFFRYCVSCKSANFQESRSFKRLLLRRRTVNEETGLTGRFRTRLQ